MLTETTLVQLIVLSYPKPIFMLHPKFIFDFSIFRTLVLGLEVVGHTVTSGTFDNMVTILITGLKRRK